MEKFSYRFNKAEAQMLIARIEYACPDTFNTHIVAIQIQDVCEKTVEGPWCPPYELTRDRLETLCHLLGYMAFEGELITKGLLPQCDHSAHCENAKNEVVLGNFFASAEGFLRETAESKNT